MKILVFGSLNVDLIFSVDHIVRPGETTGSTALTRSAGGKGANQAAALAKAGMPVYMAGKIGGDGEFLLDLLRSYGVNTNYVARYDGATGQALIQLDKNSQNAIVLFPGGNALISGEEVNAVLENFTEGDIVVLQNEINLTAEIIESAKSRNMRIYLNPSPYNERIEKLPLEKVDAFFVNEIEGAAMAGLPPPVPSAPGVFEEILSRLVRRFPESEIILTAGKAGAYYGFKETREKGDIVQGPVVDTTGAGDTFSGYYIAARVNQFPVQQALAMACKAASIAVSRKGAMTAIPVSSEVCRPENTP
jgi:ribokinase